MKKLHRTRARRLATAALATAVALSGFGGTAGTSGANAQQPHPALVSPGLAAQFAAAAPGATVTTFVRGDDETMLATALSEVGLPTLGRWDRFDVMQTAGTAVQLNQLATRPGVRYLEEERKLHWTTETSHIATQGEEASTMTFEEVIPPPPLPDKPGQRKGQVRKQPPPTVVQHGPFNGSGVSIAIVDSGIDGTNPMFLDPETNASKVIRNVKYAGEGADGATFVDLTNSTNDTDHPTLGGHGTHVAGTAGGYEVTTAAGDRLRGAAPGAALVGVSGGQAISMAFALSGLEWVLENQIPCDGCPPIRVVNNSWGSGGARHDPGSAIAVAVNTLVADGITVVFSAGNDGEKALEVQTGPDSTNPTPGVISVANVDDADAGSRDGRLNPSSSKGLNGDARTYPDVTAPGTDIRAACRPTLPVCYLGLDPAPEDVGYYELSGTSMAAPHVAGVVAVLLSANPTLTPAEIENILEDTAYRSARGGPYHLDEVRNHRGALIEAFNDSHSSFDFGHGVVDVAAALAAAVSPGTSTGNSTFCATSGAVSGDQAGDAVTADAYNGAASATEVDLRDTRLLWDANTSALIAEFDVSTVAAAPGLGAPAGTRFELDFLRGATAYRIRGARTPTGMVGDLLRVSDSVVVADGTAEFIAGSPGVVRVTLPAAKIRKTVAGVSLIGQFTAGEQLVATAVYARRYLGAVYLLADAADGACPYFVGGGNVPPTPGTVPVPNLPAMHAASLSPGQSYTWTDTRIGSSDAGYLCGSCDPKLLELVVPEGGSRFKVTTDRIGAGDLSISLSDESQRQVAIGVNSIDVMLTLPGVYAIAITPASVVAQPSYEVTAQLGEPAPPPPPPAEVADPRIQPGERYSWTSEPVVMSSPTGCGADNAGCDVTPIELVVPEGTSPTLVISISAGPADDYDLSVEKPDGTVVTVATGGSDETVTLAGAAAGVYKVIVNAWAVTPGSTYSGSAAAR